MKKNHHPKPKNLPAHELIGLKVKVVESTDPSKKGVTGKTVDETKYTLKIETKKGEKVIPKKESVFSFTLPGKKKYRVKGKKLCFKPENRTKVYWRKTK